MKTEIHRNTPNKPWTYASLDQRQREIAHQLQVGGEPTLILSELAPVVTYGRRTPESDLAGALPRPITSLYPTDRGGLATYHGPGQWVAFPVHRLETSVGDPRGVRKIICKLLEAAAEVGRIYSSQVEIRSGPELGVWTPEGKFAAVGVHVENGVLLHGLSVNGFRTPESFLGLRPCGLDLPVSYLLKQPSEANFVQLQEQITDAILRILAGDKSRDLQPPKNSDHTSGEHTVPCAHQKAPSPEKYRPVEF